MEYQQTSLMNEVEKIRTEGVNGTAYTYIAQIHVLNEKKNYRVPKVLSIDVLRDYIENFTDKVIVTVLLTKGVYANHVFRHQDNLELTLVRSPIFGNATKQHNIAERFTAVLVNDQDPTINEGTEATDEEVLDLSGMVEVQFELISRTAELLNMARCGGVFRNSTTEAFLRTVLTNEACQASNDANLIVKGVDMIPANNLEIRDHIIIPHGTKIVDLPNYVQNKCGGVYASGLGYYLQERYWYIYPAFDFTRINDTERTITFINIPKNKLPLIEQTFRYNGKQVIALATGDILMSDNSMLNARNEGNGVSFTVASTVLHNMVSSGGNKAVIDRKSSNTEAKTMDRPDSKVAMKTSDQPITDNAMRVFSEVAARSTGNIMLVWENSEPSLILPGTMVRVFYMQDNQVKNIVGVVGMVQHYTYLKQRGFSSERYVHASALTIFTDTGKTLSKGKE